MLPLLATGAQALCLVLALRMLPFVVYEVLSRHVAWRHKTAMAILYVLILAFLARLGSIAAVGCIMGGMGYYVLIGCGMNRLSRLLAERTITRGALLVVLAGLCLLLPGVALPGIAATTFLVVGWELLMCGYSYCVETSRMKTCPSITDCLFFLFVNPTLVWSRRGARLERAVDAGGGVRRAALGASIILLNALLLRPVLQFVGQGGLTRWLPGRSVVLGVAIYGVLRLLAEYAAHSGLASIQIGLARGAGWQVPERYDLPLFARSPMEFWRRWNTYVRVWLEAYVFLPTATAVARRSRSRAAQVFVAMAVLVASGLLHDGYAFAGNLVLSTRTTQLFMTAGVAALIWRVAEGISRSLRASVRGPVAAWCGAAATVTAQVLMGAGLAAAMVWLS